MVKSIKWRRNAHLDYVMMSLLGFFRKRQIRNGWKLNFVNKNKRLLHAVKTHLSCREICCSEYNDLTFFRTCLINLTYDPIRVCLGGNKSTLCFHNSLVLGFDITLFTQHTTQASTCQSYHHDNHDNHTSHRFLEEAFVDDPLTSQRYALLCS